MMRFVALLLLMGCSHAVSLGHWEDVHALSAVVTCVTGPSGMQCLDDGLRDVWLEIEEPVDAVFALERWTVCWVVDGVVACDDGRHPLDLQARVVDACGRELSTPCALLADGSIVCDEGTFAPPFDPADPAITITCDVGGQQACAVFESGHAECWGIDGPVDYYPPMEGVREICHQTLPCWTDVDGMMACASFSDEPPWDGRVIAEDLRCGYGGAMCWTDPTGRAACRRHRWDVEPTRYDPRWKAVEARSQYDWCAIDDTEEVWCGEAVMPWHQDGYL